MKLTKLCLVLGLLFCFLENNIAQDKTGSPYFYIPCQECDTEAFPLLHTEANVNIAGVIADVEVTQVYKNNGKQPIEAIYVFPASTRAAVYAMEMVIGERTITAKIEEKGKARQDYQQAKKEGKRASLLEQERPNVFQMNVANIMPGDQIQVKLKYTELLIPEEGTYQFVYPTVVGPRYAGERQEELIASSNWVGNPYLAEGEKAPYTFDLNLCMKTGIPVQKLQSNSHKVNIKYTGKAEAQIHLDASEKASGNRDFILEYRLKGKEIEKGLLVYEGEKENYFLMMVQPPERVRLEEIPGREYIFIVDISGSMFGFPLETSKKLLRDLIGKLRPTDRFNVLLFSGGANFLSEKSLPATSANINQAISILGRQRGGGGTNMLNAIKKAMAEPKIDGFSRSFVIATDGYVRVEAEAFDYIKNNLNNANFFSFGIGKSVNRHLIEGMARVGMGEPFIVTNGQEAPIQANKLRKYIESPLLTDINLSFDGLQVYDQTPAKVPDLLGERPLVVFGKFKKGEKGQIQLTGKTAKGTFRKSFTIAKATKTNESPALRYLWARHRIQQLGDYKKLNHRNNNHQDLIKEITNLGLQHNLLTSYTSFLAIDSEVVNKAGNQNTVKQPLPLPDGVSNQAVGKPNPKANYSIRKNESLSSSREYSKRRIQKQSGVLLKDQSVEEEKVLKSESTKMAPPPPPPLSPEVEEIFSITEELAIYPGCESLNSNEREVCVNEKMFGAIYKNIKYPAMARENAVEGTVIIRFKILKDGTVSDFEIVKDLGEGCGAEALRVVKLIVAKKKWTPARQRGKPVNTFYNIPIHFKLS